MKLSAFERFEHLSITDPNLLNHQEKKKKRKKKIILILYVRGAQKQLCTKQRHETLAGKICRTPISDKQCTYPCPDAKILDVRCRLCLKRPNSHGGI